MLTFGNDPLKKQGIGLLVGLTLQYILGMITTFFVQFPESGNEKQLWTTAWSNIPTALHMIIGLGLVFGSLSLIVRAFIKKDRVWKIASVTGSISIFVAAFGGAQFVSTQNDIYSFVMSLGFIAAFISYSIGVYKHKQ